MDDTFAALTQFHRALIAFHERIGAAQRELENRRDVFAAAWRDSNRQWHDQTWLPIEEELKHFLGKDGPTYLEFLDGQIRSLRDYLEG